MGSGNGLESQDPKSAIEAFIREVSCRVRRGRLTLRRPAWDKDIVIQRLTFRTRGRTVVTGREGFLEIDEFHVAEDGCDLELADSLFDITLGRYLTQQQQRERTAMQRSCLTEKNGRHLRYRRLAARLGRQGPHLTCGRNRKASVRRKK